MTQMYQVGDVVRLTRDRGGEKWDRIVRIEEVNPCKTGDCTYNVSRAHESKPFCSRCDNYMYTCKVLAGEGKDFQLGSQGHWAGYDMVKLSPEELTFYLI